MPEKVTVDLRTKFIPESRRVYILFPGAGYRYFEIMDTSGTIFLDVPGFPLGPNEQFGQLTDIVERITVSDRIKSWHLRQRPERELPPRRVSELGPIRRTPAKRQFAGLLRNFFTTLKQDDIIIVPGQSLEDDVLFGEVRLEKGIVFTDVPTLPGEKVPALGVQWIKRVKRRVIPAWLEHKIASPNPLRQIEAEHFDAIFDLMYERYSYRGYFACKYDVSSPEFSSLDSFLFQQIVLYISALHEDYFEGNIEDIASKPIAVIASSIEYSDDIPDLRISINSPGHIVLYAKNMIPIVVAAMMTVAAAAPPAAAGETPLVSFVNSVDRSSASKECQADVTAEVMEDLAAMGYVRWQELCAIEAQARLRTGINPGMPAKTESGSVAKRSN